MTNLTPKEQQELEAFIQQNFSQEDFAKIIAITALKFKIDIQGLSLKEGAQKVAEAISNMDSSAFNAKLVDILMPPKKQEVTTGEGEEGEGSLHKALARKPQQFLSPVDKLSQVLFDKRKNSVFYDDAIDSVEITVGRTKNAKKEPVVIVVSININELMPYISFSDNAILDPANRAIHDAVISLFDAGNTYITPDMVYHFLNGYSRLDKAPDGIRKAINSAMNKLMHTTITIDASKEAKAFGIAEFQFKGHILPLSYVHAKINGQECECWKVLDKPPLLTLAGRKNQINRESIHRGEGYLLDTGLSTTPDNVVITHYLLNQILTMKNVHSCRNNTILFDTLYEYLEVDAPTEKTAETLRRRIRNKVKAILDAWVASGFISGYNEVLDGRKIIGLHVQYKK